MRAPRGRCTTSEDAQDALVAAARRGDADAWAELYDAYAGPLLGYLRGQGANDPEDLLGEVFVQLVARLGDFVGDAAALRSFVFTIAHHRLVDQRRAQGRRRVELTADADLERLLPTSSTEPEALGRLATEDVVTLLSGLTDDQREVMLLRLVAGLTTREIAEVTGRDPEAIKGLVKRGTERLRTRFGTASKRPPPIPRPER